jgi:hypothetical protein
MPVDVMEVQVFIIKLVVISECTFSLAIAHLLPKSVETFPLKSISLNYAYYMSMNLMEVWYFGIKWWPDALLVW